MVVVNNLNLERRSIVETMETNASYAYARKYDAAYTLYKRISCNQVPYEMFCCSNVNHSLMPGHHGVIIDLWPHGK